MSFFKKDKTGKKILPNSTGEAQPSSLKKKKKKVRRGTRKPSSRQQQVGNEKRLRPSFPGTRTQTQFTGTGEEKSSAHTQPRGQPSQLPQLPARSRRRGRRPRLGTPRPQARGRPFAGEVPHSSPGARESRPCPRPQQAPSQRLAPGRPRPPAPPAPP